MRWLFRKFILPWYRIWALRHIRRERTLKLHGLVLKVPPGVFHPGVFFSTPIFLRFLRQQGNLSGKKTLDVGAGSGALAICAAQSGALVTALDINPLAVQTALSNARLNGLSISAVVSDLFEKIPEDPFDLILVNPPFYPVNPQNPAEHAFYAGADLDYFRRFFRSLPRYTHADSRVWMILSEDCPLADIQHIAATFGFSMSSVHRSRVWGEKLDIWSVKLRNPSP